MFKKLRIEHYENRSPDAFNLKDGSTQTKRPTNHVKNLNLKNIFDKIKSRC